VPIFLDHPKSRAALVVPGEEHLELMMKLQNEEESRQYLNRFMPLTLEQEREWLRKAVGADKLVLVVCEKKHMTPIGTMGMHAIDLKNRRGMTGTAILPAYCGMGYGTDAKMLLLTWAFNELGLQKVESRVIAFNGRSKRYSEKCGYKEITRLKKHWFRRGSWHDEILMEVFAKDWKPLWRQFCKGSFAQKKK